MAETHLKDYRLLLLLPMMIIIIIWGVPCGCCPGDQKGALLEFRSLLLLGNSSAIGEYSNWNSSTSCCEWWGISCDSRHQFVTVLALEQTGLMRELGEAGVSSDVLTPLFRLTSLRALDLSHSEIRGGIPPGFQNLTQLQTLRLSSNHFSGPIPPHLFSALPHLQELRFGGNALEGKIPVEIGNLTNLVDVFMYGNKLSGEIPATLLQLHKLETLYLEDNFLSGEIPSVQNMSRLMVLQLDNNFLSGNVPTWLFELSMIQRLYLGGNNLTFAYAKQMAPKSRFTQVSLISCNIASNGIPLWLANQTDLQILDLSSNRMTGTFPGWLAEMHLEELYLADNLLQGTLPPELGLNPHIYRLDLSKNNFEGEVYPNRDANKTKQNDYEVLILSDNKFTGSLGPHISNMPDLAYLDLSRNQFSGQPFIFLCRNASYNCPSYINLSFNIFHGNISISSSSASSLAALDVAHNHFSKIYYLPKNLYILYLIDLRDNRISGEIPTSLAEISSLRILSLWNNLLQGPIPATLSKLISLQILDLSGNKLSGRVPGSLGNLTGMTAAPNDLPILESSLDLIEAYFYDDMLRSASISWLEVFWKTHHRGLPNKHLGLYTFLDLSNNQLSGAIPKSLGNLRSLKVLNLSHNSLSSRIPASFGNMKELESLDLSRNNLSGEIPASLGTLLQITNLQLSDNNLCGRIPAGPQMERS